MPEIKLNRLTGTAIEAIWLLMELAVAVTITIWEEDQM